MRPPDAAALRYRAALRKLVKGWQKGLWTELEPTLAGALPNPDRQDAEPLTPAQVLEKYRLRIRPRAEAQAGHVRTAASDVAKHNAREFGRVVGIPIQAVQPGIAPILENFQAQNLELIESLAGTELDQLGDVIAESISQGLRVEELRDLILERFQVTESRADLIARDQTLKLNGQLTRVRHTSAGIVEYIWTTANDERVRGNPALKRRGGADHFHLNGTTCRWDAPPVTNPSTGATNNPGEDFQCRCVAFPVIPDYSEESDDGEEVAAE
jgi:SPP1 gp7 family putative phage head morphogenesis protein